MNAPRLIAFCIVSAIATLVTPALQGCASDAPRGNRIHTLRTTPTDFVLSVTVGKDGIPHTEGSPRTAANNGARFMVEPDRAFRAAFGPGCTPSTYPGLTRVLSPSQADRLWLRLSRSQWGASNAAFAGGMVHADEPVPAGHALVTFHSNGTWKSALLPATDDAIAGLMADLKTLAWSPPHPPHPPLSSEKP